MIRATAVRLRFSATIRLAVQSARVPGVQRLLLMDVKGDWMRAFTRRRGFSLIELLVAISIMAVLIGLLLPALPRVMDSARRTACGANLRSVGQAVELYKNNFKEKFPLARYMPYPWLSGQDQRGIPSLPEALEAGGGFEANSEGWRCPGDKIVWETEFDDPETGERRRCNASYTYVTGLADRLYEETFFARFLEQGPSDTPVGYDFDGGLFETDPQVDGENPRFIKVDFFHATRNVLFVDGSVSKYGDQGVQND